MHIPRIKHANTAGFTLMELMIVVAVLGMLSIGLFQVLHGSRDSYERQKVTLEMQQNARAAIAAMADDFRHVSYGKDPTQPSIEYAYRDSIVFVADVIAEIPGAERISYALSPHGDPDTPNPSDTILMKTVADSGGVVLFSEPQSYGIKIGGLSLRYFNGAGIELPNNPVPQPELVGETLIEITAVEPQAHKIAGTYLEETLSTTIYPRNLPLTPARSRPTTPVVGPLSVPNCESITVPWITPTSNTDGTPLELGDISHFTVYFGTHPDSLSLYSRVARTINEWTVSGLVGGTDYYLGVSCTSRSGVESYKGIDHCNLSSSVIPEQPTGFAWQVNPAGPGIRLDWNPVTHFTNSSTITTPVTYNVYRDTAPGVHPDAAFLIASVEVSNWHIDEEPVDCALYYYVVAAEACSNEGAPTGEVVASCPAPPAVVSGIGAELSATPGELNVSWTLPVQRADGTPLDPTDIGFSRVYYDTTAYTYGNYADASGAATDLLLTGLLTCTTYFINVACADQCPNLGDLQPINEIQIDTAEPCDPGIPAAVTYLRAHGLDERIDLAWPANQSDCDLYGYRVYYDIDAGPPYAGSGSPQGASPITFDVGSVADGDSCRASLTGLAVCQGYYFMVTCIDGCATPNESPPSIEVAATTECISCALEPGCAGYMASGMDNTDVRLEVYPGDSQEMLVDRLTANWTGPRSVVQVWGGRPLTCLWDSDGSVGAGPLGTQPSGIELDLSDFAIPGSGVEYDGTPIMLRFDGAMTGSTIDMNFRGESGSGCTLDPRQIQEGLYYEDFDDGSAQGWYASGGSWSLVGGELYQGSSYGAALAYYPGPFTDFTLEAKVNTVYSQTSYITFRGLNTSNVHMLGLKTYDNTVRLCRYVSGSWTVMASASASLSNNRWYQLRITVEGNTITAFVDCEQVLQVTDTTMQPAGFIGARTYASRAYFDDFRIYVPVGS